MPLPAGTPRPFPCNHGPRGAEIWNVTPSPAYIYIYIYIAKCCNGIAWGKKYQGNVKRNLKPPPPPHPHPRSRFFPYQNFASETRHRVRVASYLGWETNLDALLRVKPYENLEKVHTLLNDLYQEQKFYLQWIQQEGNYVHYFRWNSLSGHSKEPVCSVSADIEMRLRTVRIQRFEADDQFLGFGTWWNGQITRVKNFFVPKKDAKYLFIIYPIYCYSIHC